MKVLVSVAPQAVWQAHQAQFELVTVGDAAHLADATAKLLLPVQSPAQLAALLSRYPEAELAIAYQAPELVLAALLAAGDSTEQAGAKWHAATEALLQLQQQQRRRVKLFNLSALANSNQHNATNTDVPDNDATNGSALPGWITLRAGSPPAAADTVHTLLAAQILRQQPQLATLQQRLYACSLPLQQQAEYQLNLAGIMAQITDDTELRQLKAQQSTLQQQLKATGDERDVLLQQLLHVQEELEQLFDKKQTVKQQYARLEQDYRNDVSELSGKLQHGTQTVEKTAAQLHKLQDELKRVTDAHNKTQQQLTASNDERDLLLQQLLHVQEELEQLFGKKQTVKQQYTKLEQDYLNDVANLSAKLQHGEHTIEKTAGQLHKLQDELHRITNAHNQSQQQLKHLTETEQKLQHQLQAERSQRAADNGERELLLQQLMQVQEQLEQYYLQWQQAEHKANHTETAREKQQQREVTKLESQLRKTKARAAGAEHQLQLAQQQMNTVKNSTLWKSGAPVRMLTRLVTKIDKAKQKLQQEAALIITSEYFDIDWYLARNPDVAQSNINPAEHYLRFGASEGRMPGPLFDGDWYKQRYPDVAASGINPLLHFIKFGQQEGRTASPKLLEDHSDHKIL